MERLDGTGPERSELRGGGRAWTLGVYAETDGYRATSGSTDDLLLKYADVGVEPKIDAMRSELLRIRTRVAVAVLAALDGAVLPEKIRERTRCSGVISSIAVIVTDTGSELVYRELLIRPLLGTRLAV